MGIKKVLEDATKNNQQALASYSMEEISKKSQEGERACRDMYNYLMFRLTSNHTECRHKSLQIIKHLMQHGHPFFKESLQRNHDAVSQSLSYRAQKPDPYRGDQPAKDVRELASELMNMMFERDVVPSTSSAPRAVPASFTTSVQRSRVSLSGRQMEGLGSSSGASSSKRSKAPSEGTSRLSNMLQGGAGAARRNQPWENPSTSNALGMNPISGLTKSAGGGGSSLKAAKKEAASAHMPASFDIRGVGSNTGSGGSDRPAVSHSYAHSLEPVSIRARRGGGWYSESDDAASAAAAAGAAASSPSSTASPLSVPAQEHPESHIAPLRSSQGEYEARLVNEICAPGGVRATPPRAALQTFVSRCASLDRGAVVANLIDKMEDVDLTVRTKAVHTLEALASHAAFTDIAGHLPQYADELRDAQQAVTNPLARTKAARLLSMASGAPPTISPAATFASAPVPAAPAPTPVPSSAPTAVPRSEPPDLLTQLTEMAGTPSPPPSAGTPVAQSPVAHLSPVVAAPAPAPAPAPRPTVVLPAAPIRPVPVPIGGGPASAPVPRVQIPAPVLPASASASAPAPAPPAAPASGELLLTVGNAPATTSSSASLLNGLSWNQPAASPAPAAPTPTGGNTHTSPSLSAIPSPNLPMGPLPGMMPTTMMPGMAMQPMGTVPVMTPQQMQMYQMQMQMQMMALQQAAMQQQQHQHRRSSNARPPQPGTPTQTSSATSSDGFDFLDDDAAKKPADAFSFVRDAIDSGGL